MFEIRIPQATEKGYIECPIGGCFDWSNVKSKTHRGRVQEGGAVTPAITCNPEIYYYEGIEEE